MTLRLLVLSGTVGVGKTTVGEEVHDVLSERRIPNAFFDLDALRYQWPETSPWNAELLVEHLAALWPNLARRDVEHLVLAGVMETPGDLDRVRTALPPATATVIRLTAPADIRAARLRDRMLPGEALDWHLARTVELDAILDASAVEMIAVDNGDRPPRDVAVEVLDRAGWATAP
jgi:adenylylsulfate kinase